MLELVWGMDGNGFVGLRLGDIWRSGDHGGCGSRPTSYMSRWFISQLQDRIRKGAFYRPILSKFTLKGEFCLHQKSPRGLNRKVRLVDPDGSVQAETPWRCCPLSLTESKVSKTCTTQIQLLRSVKWCIVCVASWSMLILNKSNLRLNEWQKFTDSMMRCLVLGDGSCLERPCRDRHTMKYHEIPL